MGIFPRGYREKELRGIENLFGGLYILNRSISHFSASFAGSEDKGCQSQIMKVYTFFSCGLGDRPYVSSPGLPEDLA
jgi:hypothetical protein